MRNRHLIIRADATARIGTGHVMRCLALAQAWIHRGGSVTFFSHCESEYLLDRLRDNGSHVVLVERPYPAPDDAQGLLSYLNREHARRAQPWLVLDGYHFDSTFQDSMKQTGIRLLVVDDYNHLNRYHADILVNQNIGAENLAYSHDANTVGLFGTTYALLRREFLGGEKVNRAYTPQRRTILVTMGGADPENLTLKAVRAIIQSGLKHVKIDIVLGPANPNIAAIERELDWHAAAQTDPSLQFHIHRTADMPAILSKTSLAIAAGGSTCWELCFFGIPSILIVAAENQRRVVAGLAQAGAALSAGWHGTLQEHRLSLAVNALFNNIEQRLSMSRIGRTLVDGKGCHRVIDMMYWMETIHEDAPLPLRKATPADVFQIWKLANEPDARRNSFHPEPIPFDHHVRWFNAKLDSNDSVMYVVEIGKVVLSQIRYDKKEDGAEISFAVAPAFRGKGLGGKLLRETWEKACQELGVARVRGIVKATNEASASSFLKAGFTMIGGDASSGVSCLVFEKELR